VALVAEEKALEEELADVKEEAAVEEAVRVQSAYDEANAREERNRAATGALMVGGEPRARVAGRAARRGRACGRVWARGGGGTEGACPGARLGRRGTLRACVGARCRPVRRGRRARWACAAPARACVPHAPHARRHATRHATRRRAHTRHRTLVSDAPPLTRPRPRVRPSRPQRCWAAARCTAS
jgi:hypothetical protein